MNVNIIKGDLFTADKECVLAHCISSDFALGAGIAKIFRNKLGTKEELERKYTGEWDGNGYCAFTNEAEWLVANLITKERSFHKPVYKTLQQALEDFKRQLVVFSSVSESRKIAMPLIGCGLDGLEWKNVRDIIGKVFGDTKYEISVYVLTDDEYSRVCEIEKEHRLN